VDEEEARRVLDHEVAALRALSYDELRLRMPQVRRRVWFVNFVDHPQVDPNREVTAESGAVYQVETLVDWDGATDANLRVIVAIDDGGPSAYKPMTDSFIMAPDGSFVGE
jgi:hypothetical protein